MKLVERFLAPLLFGLLASCALYLSIYEPLHNWDVVGYVAAAKSYELKDTESLHAFTYKELRGALSAEEYKKITEAGSIDKESAYRPAIAADASAFKEQLQFYQIRPIYIGIIYLLYRHGVDIEFATHLISGIAVAGALVILYILAVSFLARPFVYLLALLAILSRALFVARYSTPDGLALLAVISIVGVYFNGYMRLLLAVLPVTLGIRTDLILFMLPLLCLLFAFQANKRREIALSIAASFIVYVGITRYYGNVGWQTFFYCSTVQRCLHPISMPHTLTVDIYLTAFSTGAGELVKDKVFLFYAMMALPLCYLIKASWQRSSKAVAMSSPAVVLAFVSYAYTIGRFLIFPSDWGRFFTAPFLVAAFSLLAMSTDYLQASKLDRYLVFPWHWRRNSNMDVKLDHRPSISEWE